MEYVFGPVMALLLAMKFTDFRAKKAEDEIKTLDERIEYVEEEIESKDKELPTKLTGMLMPMTKAIKRLNDQVGI